MKDADIYIRPLEISDAEVSFRWRNDEEVWRLTQNRPKDQVTAEMELEWIRKVLVRTNEMRFAICLTETNEYIGNVQLTDINSYQAQFHIFIGNKQYWGKGIGAIATRKMINYGFDELKLQSVYLFVNEENVPAIKAYEKAGFRKISDEEEKGTIRMAIYIGREREIKVSVLMLAYNHEKFIRQALDGIFMQTTKFNVEVVIGEDKSTDNTREILLEYAKLYPGALVLILNETNRGAGINQIAALNACRGKYVAICEGDDYWTEPNKLQLQVDFLELNPEFAICFHRVYELENKEKKVSSLYGSSKEETYTIQDLAKENIMHTPSVVYRNGLIGGFPEWFHESPVGDYVLHMLNARHGKIKYLPDVMAVYRIHAEGSWSKKDLGWIFKRWVNVLDFLLRENFSAEVKEILKNQRYRTIKVYLEILYFKDEASFLKELNRFTEVDPVLAKEWLLVHYPELLKKCRERITGTREFKTGSLIVGPLRRVKSFFKPDLYSSKN